jgi:GNAT superfamily N-acetyltransferase
MARCELCRLRFDPNSPEDCARHRRVHDVAVNGLRYRQTPSDRIIAEEDGWRVAVVSRESPFAQRRRAVRAFRIASREMGYSGAGYAKREPKEDDTHAFLLYRGSRLIGIFLLAYRTRWVEGAWNEEEPRGDAEVSGWSVPKRGRGAEPLWSVDFMWIARKHRRQGYGRLLLQRAAHFLGTTVEQFAWLPPFTPFGKAFIRHVRPREFRAAQ